MDTPSSVMPQLLVLVVDDEDTLRRMLMRMLVEQGYAVLDAHDGHEALALLAHLTTPVHLVVTDISMPGMDGRELGRRIAERWPALPVLYMSGYTPNATPEGGDALQPFVAKPFDPATLLALVEQLLLPAPGAG